MILQNMNRGTYDGEATIYGHEEVIAILEKIAGEVLSEKETKNLGKRLHMVVVEDGEKKLYCSQLWIYNGENVQGETCGVEVCCKDKVGKNNSRNRGIYSRGQILCNFT